MLKALLARRQQRYRTMRFPDGPAPELPDRFVGRPVIQNSKCASNCTACIDECPTKAITVGCAQRTDSDTCEYNAGEEGRLLTRTPGAKNQNPLQLDTGRCIFCQACQHACDTGSITFSKEFRMAASTRQDLVVADNTDQPQVHINNVIKRVLGRSLKLRQVSAGGCNACEMDTNVLNTVGWDLGRFGIQFVASPRHADGLLITGPVTENMRLALEKTYQAVPEPKIVIAVGACATSGGIYADHAEANNGAASIVPVDVFVPGCPPHPLTILDALLKIIG